MNSQHLLDSARRGQDGSLGQLLQLYQNYLHVLADSQLDRKLRTRVGPSDVVQETLLAAHRDFKQFCGRSEREFLAWLRQILINCVFRCVEKNILAEKRDVRREISLEQVKHGIERSGTRLGSMLAASGASPSSAAVHRENAVRLADCMAQLAPQYREVLVLRNFKSMPFERVAEEMGRKPGSTRVLWVRAVKRLRELFDAQETTK
jgi:RNA polymerase sigma-70 factor (ECF subfamily)